MEKEKNVRAAFSAAVGDDEEWYPGDEWLDWVFSSGLNPDDMD